jgi:uncharacterized protein YecE (DUF72 family)
MATPDLRIGISGWTYAGWRGGFYPDGLAQKRELEYASRRLNAIEINGTFYSLQRPSSFGTWYDATPADFRFAIKGSRFITHMKQLRDVETALANFFAQGVLRLEEKLGPILWQFPERMRYDRARFDDFFALLPRDRSAALGLARGHDARLDGRAWLEASNSRRLRYAIEVRHESFMNAEFLALLRRQGFALVFSDAGPHWPYAEDVTAGFIYARLHGAKEIYTSGYGRAALDRWARAIVAWSRGDEPADAQRVGTAKPPARKTRDVWVFFDNDRKVRAPHDAQALTRRLGLEWQQANPWMAEQARRR